MIKAEIITIGDEILIGQIVDTNSAWMAKELNKIGIAVYQITSVSDQREHIIQALDNAKKNVDIILITGGLGPTKDDITKKVLAEYFHTKLVQNEQVLKDVQDFITGRRVTMNALNVLQAEVLENCEVIRNHYGTAPGMWIEQEGKIFISMPGVPYEMKGIMEKYIIPKFVQRFKTQHIIHKTLLVHGVPESQLATNLSEWEDALPKSIKLAYLPSPGLIRLRFTTYTENLDAGNEMINQEIEKLYQLIPDNISGYEEENIESLIGNILREKELTLSTAESCTGGYIASQITSVSGSSDYFIGSVVAYHNSIKENILEVPSAYIEEFGAVSREVVEVMAKGCLKRFRTNYAIATSGIAGPTGGTKEKPVGTVWIAVASENNVVSQMFIFGKEREINIKKSSSTALNMLLNMIYAERK